MMKSLRGRLFLGLTLLIVATAGCGGYLAYSWAFDETIEMQDSILAQIGAVALHASFHDDMPLRGVDAEAQVVIEEMRNNPQDKNPDSRFWSLADGLHIAVRGGQQWRVLLQTRPDGSRFAVGQPTMIRDEIARGTALRTVLPIAALIPCLMVVIALVIAQSLRPMTQLAMHLDNQRPDDLEMLPLKNVSRELQPFVASINRLLERIQTILHHQRRFIADAAHELRTPITALSLQAENLDQIELSEEARSRAAHLKQGTRRMKHLVEQLLMLARFESGEPTDTVPVTSLEACAKNVIGELLPEAESRNVDLGFQSLEQVSTNGEPIMISVVIRNLVDNALRYTPTGGRVDVGLYSENDQAILQVEDTGPGLPSDDLERIFDPFYRGSKPIGEGTGLGLSIVKRIVDRLGGSVSLENITDADRTGLRVVVKLPLTA